MSAYLTIDDTPGKPFTTVTLECSTCGQTVYVRRLTEDDNGDAAAVFDIDRWVQHVKEVHPCPTT